MSCTRQMRRVGVALPVWLAAAVAQAQAPEAEPVPEAAAEAGVPEVDAAPPGPLLTTSVTGYLDTRITYNQVVVDGPLPARDTPALTHLTEDNTQLKLSW